MRKIVYFFIFLTFISAGCATLQHVAIPVYPDPKPDMGLVYFYRAPKFAGSAIHFSLYDGDKKIGALASGTYFFYWTDPGEHTFWAETESKSSRKFTVEPGKIYYIRGDIEFGFFVGAPQLTVVNEIEGEGGVRECKYAIIKEEFKKLPEEEQAKIVAKEKETKLETSNKDINERKEMMKGRRR